MSQPLTFRARTGYVWFAVVFGGVLLYVHDRLFLGAFALVAGSGAAPPLRNVLLIVYAAAVVAVFAFSRRRVVVDDEGLAERWLWWPQQIAWEEITRVRLPWDRGIFVPGVVLELDRPRREFWTLWCGPRPRMAIADGLRGFEKLVRESVARAPQATVSEGVRAYLAAPRRVPWRHRLPTLLPLGVLAGALAAAMARTLAHGAFGFGLVAVIYSAGCVLMALGGRTLGREWPWKVPLAIATGVLPMAGLPVVMAAMFVPLTTLLLTTLAGCLAWTVATFVLCLPCRPRWHWAASGYALALAAALAATWWYARGEALPFRETEPFSGDVMWTAWPPDGSTLCASASRDQPEVGLCHIVDTKSLALRSFRLPSWPLLCWMPAPDLVFYRAGREGEAGAETHELWALDARTGEERRVLAAPVISTAYWYSTSPNGTKAALLAGPKGELAVHLVRLTDLSVQRLKVEGGPARIGSVRWRGDGELLLVECPRGPSEDDGRPQTLTFWACSVADPRPTRLYQKTGPVVGWSMATRARWALLAVGPTYETREQHELVDLTTGAARPLKLPGRPMAYAVEWTPDGAAFAYICEDAGVTVIVAVVAATGRVSRLYATGDELSSLCLSADSRYAACVVDREFCQRVRIVDLTTGQATTLRQALPKGRLWFGPRWSPTEPVLAVVHRDNLRRSRTASFRFFRFSSAE